MSTLPTTIRETDSSPVEMEQAQQEWAVAARPELERVAKTYGGIIRYAELAEAVQVSTGIRTRKLTHHWIGHVLARVGADCHERGEPLLSALCVQKDGAIGDGYGVALVKIRGGDLPADLELQAAEERLRCYENFGAVMPADGGRPQMTREVILRRRKAAKAAKEDAPKATCPKCNIVLPAMGSHCYYCEE